MRTPSRWRIATIWFKRKRSAQNHHLTLVDNVAAEAIVYPWGITNPILHPNEGRHCENVDIIQAWIFLGSGCTTVDVAIGLLVHVSLEWEETHILCEELSAAELKPPQKSLRDLGISPLACTRCQTIALTSYTSISPIDAYM